MQETVTPSTGLLRTLFVIFITIAGAAGVSAQLQGGFNPDLDYRGGAQPYPKPVHAFVVQQSGKLIVAAGDKIIRLNPDGTKDAVIVDVASAFSASGSVMETQADGKILVGLSYVSGSGPRMIRLNADGSLDGSFNAPRDPASGAYGWITAIAVAANGDIYIADRFEGGHVRIFKLRPDGSTYAIPDFWPLTVSGGTNSALPVEDLLIDAGGKLVVAGAVTSTNLPTTRDMFRVNNDGGLDTTFNPPDFNNGWVHAVVQRTDGKFIAGGVFTVTNGTDIRQGLARFNSDGTLDGAYNTGNSNHISALTLLPDNSTMWGLGSNGFVGRTDANGVVDTSRVFSPTGAGHVLSVAVLPDGSVYANGTDLRVANSGTINLLRFHPNGRPDVPSSKFDYDNDLASDLTVYRPSNRLWYTQTGQNYTVFEFGFATDEPVPADYDGDAKTDIAVWRPSDGTWYWINSSNITFSTLQWGQDGDVPIGGNVAWDRKAPFTIYRPSTGTWYRLEGTGYRINVLQFGLPGDVPLHGRYLDRAPFQSTPTLYRPSTRQFVMGYWEVPAPALPTVVQWGQAGDIPVCGDFDGDFITDVGVYRPSTGRWEIRRSIVNNNPTLALYAWTWGQPGDIPVVADYNGDLYDDIAVFRPSTGEWYIIHSPPAVNQQPTSFVTRTFGVAGDRPVPAAYLP